MLNDFFIPELKEVNVDDPFFQENGEEKNLMGALFRFVKIWRGLQDRLRYLVFLNLSLDTLTITDLWKLSKVVPLLNQWTMESFISEYLSFPKAIEVLLLLSFKVQSTKSALNAISTHVVQDLNQSRSCAWNVLLALNSSKAFGTINHAPLLSYIDDPLLLSQWKRWTLNSWVDRQYSVEFWGRTFRLRNIKQGVPLGGAFLWFHMPVNFYLRNPRLTFPPVERRGNGRGNLRTPL